MVYVTCSSLLYRNCLNHCPSRRCRIASPGTCYQMLFAFKGCGKNFCNVLVVSCFSGLDEKTEPDSSLQGNSSARCTCPSTTKSPCSPKIAGNAAAVQSNPSVCLRCCEHGMRRSWTEEKQCEIDNVLMDVDDFEQEVTVASEH